VSVAAPAVTPRQLGIPETMPLPRRGGRAIGMVGFGGIARGSHAPAYQAAGWPMVAVADPDPAAREIARERFGIERVYDDYRPLIADERVEVVDLLTQPTVREEVVVAAAEAGKHIIVEKPLARTIGECRRMIEAAERSGVKLAVHQNYRWHRMCFHARHIIARGLIGAPFFAGIEIMGSQDVHLAGHPFYSTCDDFLTVQWDNHLADLLRYWLGRDAARVLARTGRMNGQSFTSDNLLAVIADFGPGVTGAILHSELVRGGLTGVRCRVDGDQGSLVFDFADVLQLDSTVLGGGVRTLDVSGIEYPSSFCGTMGDLLLAIEDDREPLVSGRENLATIRTILAEHASAQAGGEWVACGSEK
jgi:predicted dehydrogenase